MARTENRSVTGMPQGLIALAAFALVLRLLDMGLAAHREQSCIPSPDARAVWSEYPKPVSLKSLKIEKRAERHVPDFAPETTALIEDLLRQSQTANKHVLYEFCSNTSDPCKKMESTSLANAQINSLIKDNFHPVRIVDRQREMGRNPRTVSDLHKKYHVFAFPTLVVADRNGEPVASLIGNCSSLTTYRFLSRSVFQLRRLETAENPAEKHITAGLLP